MTYSGDPKQLRCLVSALVAVGLLLLLFMMIVLPWWNKMASYDEEASSIADRIGRYQNLIANKPVLEEQLQALRKNQNQQGIFLTAPTAELAAANLQKQAKDAVSKAGGTLVSTQNLQADGKSAQGKVSVRVRLKGDVGALLGVLHNIESAHPLAFVENLTIKSRRTVKGRRKNRVTTYSLDVSFDLVGYLLGGKG